MLVHTKGCALLCVVVAAACAAKCAAQHAAYTLQVRPLSVVLEAHTDDVLEWAVVGVEGTSPYAILGAGDNTVWLESAADHDDSSIGTPIAVRLRTEGTDGYIPGPMYLTTTDSDGLQRRYYSAELDFRKVDCETSCSLDYPLTEITGDLGTTYDIEVRVAASEGASAEYEMSPYIYWVGAPDGPSQGTVVATPLLTSAIHTNGAHGWFSIDLPWVGIPDVAYVGTTSTDGFSPHSITVTRQGDATGGAEETWQVFGSNSMNVDCDRICELGFPVLRNRNLALQALLVDGRDSFSSLSDPQVLFTPATLDSAVIAPLGSQLPHNFIEFDLPGVHQVARIVMRWFYWSNVGTWSLLVRENGEWVTAASVVGRPATTEKLEVVDFSPVTGERFKIEFIANNPILAAEAALGRSPNMGRLRTIELYGMAVRDARHAQEGELLDFVMFSTSPPAVAAGGERFASPVVVALATPGDVGGTVPDDSTDAVVFLAGQPVQVVLALAGTAESGAAAVLKGMTQAVVTDGDALYSFDDLSIDLAGSYQLVAYASTGARTAVSSTITIETGEASKVVLDVAPADIQVAGVVVNAAPSITIVDAGGNAVDTPGVVRVLIIYGGVEAPFQSQALKGRKTMSIVSGTATFTDLAISDAQPAALRFCADLDDTPADFSGLNCIDSPVMDVNLCPSGHAPIDGACRECELGTFSDRSGNRVQCQPCPAGTFGDEPGLASCRPCEVGFYNSLTGATSILACLPCPDGTTTISNGAETVLQCTARSGKVTVVRDADDPVVLVYECPSGAVCPSGSTVGNLTILPGFWRATSNTTVLHPCDTPQWCIGGKTGASTPSSVCREGHSGPLCAGKCEDGWYMTSSGCMKCGDLNLVGVFALLSSCIVVGCGAYCCRSKRGTAASMQATDEPANGMAQVVPSSETTECSEDGRQRPTPSAVLATEPPAAASAANSVSSSVVEVDELRGSEAPDKFVRTASTDITAVNKLTEALERQSSNEQSEPDSTADAENSGVMMLRVKLLVSGLQLMLSSQRIFGVNWPDVLVDFTSVLAFLELDVWRFVSFGCLPWRSWYTDMVAMILLPALIGVVIWLWGRRGDANRRVVAFERMLVVSFVSFMPINTRLFNTIRCREFEDGSYHLVADLAVDCNAPERAAWMVVVWVGIVLVPIGIPLAYLVLLCRQRATLYPKLPGIQRGHDHRHDSRLLEQREKHSHKVAHLRGLFAYYLPKYYWTEVVIMVTKSVLTGFIVFAAPGSATQIFLALTLSILVIYFFAEARPFVNSYHDAQNLLAWTAYALFLVMALILKTKASDAEGYSGLMGGLMVAVHAALLLAGIRYLVVHQLVSRYRFVRKAQPLVPLCSWHFLISFLTRKKRAPRRCHCPQCRSDALPGTDVAKPHTGSGALAWQEIKS